MSIEPLDRDSRIVRSVTEEKRVLITGGAGFIGSNFTRMMRERHPEWRLTVLDKLTYAGNLRNLEGIETEITFVHGDVAEPATVRELMQSVDTVVHFAAESHVDRSLMDPRPFARTNVEGTLVLLEEARRAKVTRFLHVSTDEVYGDVSGTDVLSLEHDRFNPSSPYAATKTAAEHLVMSYARSYALPVVITRGSNTYGPYQYPEKIIPLFITRALQNQTLPVYGGGDAVRDYLHVEDHCSGVEQVLLNGLLGEAYNLGAREQITGVEVARRILQALGKPRELLQFVEDRAGHDYRYAVDPSRAEHLGWSREWTFDRGLEQTVRWYVEQRTWWQPSAERQGGLS